MSATVKSVRPVTRGRPAAVLTSYEDQTRWTLDLEASTDEALRSGFVCPVNDRFPGITGYSGFDGMQGHVFCKRDGIQGRHHVARNLHDGDDDSRILHDQSSISYFLSATLKSPCVVLLAALTMG